NIDVDVSAAGFTAEDGVWTRRIQLPAKGDSQTARFVLEAKQSAVGQRWVSLRFSHEGRVLGSASRSIEAVEATSAEEPRVRRSDLLTPQMRGLSFVKPMPTRLYLEAEPPDLDIVIEYDDPD